MIRYFLNGVECTPMERRAIKFKTVFDSRRFGEFEMSAKNLTFVRKDKELIQEWIAQRGYGVGMPFDVTFTNGQNKAFYLDFSTATFRENSISVEAKVRKENDTFWAKAQGLTFSDSPIFKWQPRHFCQINFVVVPEQQVSLVLTMSVTTFILAKEAATAVKNTGDDAVALMQAVGVNPSLVAGAALKLAVTLIYLTAIIIALVRLAQEMINLIYPRVRQFKAVELVTLIANGCRALGYDFNSNFLKGIKGLTLLPVPLKAKGTSFFSELFLQNSLAFSNGYPSAQDSIITLEQVISAMEQIFNLKTRVANNEVRLEPATFWQPNPTVVKDEAFNVQGDVESEFTVNLNEQFKRKLLVWDVDNSDFHTLDDTDDTIREFDSRATVLPARGEDLELLAGLERINIPFARAVRKGGLNIVEQTMRVLAQGLDLFTNGSASARITSRAGAMQISQLFFGKTKLLIRNGSQVAENQNEIIGAKALGKYHESTFVQKNLSKIYSQMPLRVTEGDFMALVKNNHLILESGKQIEIIAIEWSEESNFATVDYRVKIEDTKLITTPL